MERLLWIGDPYFAGELAVCGWTHSIIHTPAPGVPLSWAGLTHIAGFAPDVVVVHPGENTPAVLGVENFPCLTVFSSASPRLHPWHATYAQGFDAALVSSYDELPSFGDALLPAENIWWSPPFASAIARPNPLVPPIWDCLFMENPKKSASLAFRKEIAGQLADFHTESGDPATLFPRARVLLHHAMASELEGLVFEAMGRGCCVVTPRVNDGLGKLFVDGEQLVAYAPGNAGDALYRVNFLLKRPELRDHIANEAMEEINARHRAIHRAQSLTDHLCDLYIGGADALIEARLRDGRRRKFLEEIYLLPGMENASDELKDAFAAAARGKFGPGGIED